MNRYPYNNGHLMIATNRHIDTIEKMTVDEQLEWMSLTSLVVGILKEKMQPQGLNIGVNLGQVAGAGLKDHIHQHVVPRWSGDTNFMPVISDTRVVAQSLTELYDLLLPAFTSR
jgi:ATP adenylyltransferase